MKKRVFIFGATGSIGTSTIYIIKKHNDSLELAGFTYFNNYEKAKKINVCFPNAKVIKYSDNIDLNDIYNLNIDYIINAIPGFSGLKVTLFFLERDSIIGLANKESLVIAGNLINKLLKKHKSIIYPIDSEHFALKKLIDSRDPKMINKAYITASGGPFYKIKKAEFKNIKLEDALKHPKWKMGQYITINSSTMMNKAFELIEAHHLFNLQKDMISAIIHPECMVHAILNLKNGETLFHLFNPDMKIVIADFLLDKTNNIQPNMNLLETKNMSFLELDKNKFNAINLSYRVFNNNKLGQVLNTANEFFVNLFVNNKISYNEIIIWVKKVFNSFDNNNVIKFKCFEDHLKFNQVIINKCQELFEKNSNNV